MQRVRYLIVALALWLASMPALAATAVSTDPVTTGGSGSAVRATSSASRVILRPQTAASMRGLESRLNRDGATIVERSSDGATLLVEVPWGRGAADYARDVAASVPTAVAEPLGYVYASATPTDPDYSRQWGLPAIGAPSAWDRTWGASDVVVAVIDSGVDLDQPDLAAQIVPGGWDYVEDDAVPDDVLGHGTHVAGIVAAEASNGVLGSGVAPDCGILPLRVLDASGSGTTLDLGEAIYRATDQGADVINMSLGTPEQSTYVSDAVAYAIAHDVVVVAAAGNVYPPKYPRLSDVQYPAREPGVIAVGAIQNTSPYTIASFSQDGAGLDVVAPGAYIFSTVIGTTGAYWDGTSMATPFVAGAAALMRTVVPGATQADISTALATTALDLGAAGRDNTYGYGLIRVAAAIDRIDAPITALTTDVEPATSGWYLAAPQITLTPNEPATTSYAWDGGGAVTYVGAFGAPEGSHTLTYWSVDPESNTEDVQTRLFRVDTADPTVPTGLAAAAASATSVNLSWNAATDATSGVKGYRIYRDGTALTDTTSTSYLVGGLVPETGYSFAVAALDVAGNESARSAARTATTPSAPPVITSTSLPGATAGRSYSAMVAVTSSAPVSWSVSAGSLPPGLSLDPATGAIAGIPGGSGAYSFTVRADSSGGFDTQALSITVVRLAVPVYRFYNVTNGTHFFTDSAAERDMVIATWPAVYSYEGVAFTTNPLNNTQPLFRFYNRLSGSHFYTASPEEAATVLARWSAVFTLDGQTYAVNPAPVADSIPVYRFYHLNNGSHFYTASATERDLVIAKWPGVYSYEGPAFWLGQ